MTQRFSLRPSPLLSSLLLFMHALAAASALLLPSWWSVAALALILPSLFYALLHFARLRLPGSCIALELVGDEVVLHCRDGRSVTGLVQRDTLVTPWLVVLNLLPQGQWRSHSVVVMRDAMDQEDMRKLRVALRWPR